MKEKLNNKNVGIACIVIGGIIFVAGIVLFVLYNSVNLYAQKADATIVSRYTVNSQEDDEPHMMLELAYRVGDEMVYTTESVFEEIPEEELNREIYYNVKNPKEVLDAGWHLEPIVPSAFGVSTGVLSLGSRVESILLCSSLTIRP